MVVRHAAHECTGRDVARSYERLDESDLARLGRAAEAELTAFFARKPHLAGWQDRLRIVALAQGGAEHYLRGRRGIWDLDVIVCFAEDPRLPRLFRRMVVSWDWGPSKLGRCPYDPPEYTGRAVDVAFRVIPDRTSAAAALRDGLTAAVTERERLARLAGRCFARPCRFGALSQTADRDRQLVVMRALEAVRSELRAGRRKHS